MLDIINVDLDKEAEAELIKLCSEHLLDYVEEAENVTGCRFINERIAAKRFINDCDGCTNRFVIDTMHDMEMAIETTVWELTKDDIDFYTEPVTTYDNYEDF